MYLLLEFMIRLTSSLSELAMLVSQEGIILLGDSYIFYTGCVVFATKKRGVRNQKRGVRNQKRGVRNQKRGVRNQFSWLRTPQKTQFLLFPPWRSLAR